MSRILMLLCLWLTMAVLSAAEETSPLVVFSPKDPLPRIRHGHPYVGSMDYMGMFRADAPWSHAAGHVKVFKFYPQFLAGASDADLKQAISDLNRRGIAIGMEIGALLKTAAYGEGVEGFGGQKGLERAQRIKDLGGTLRYISLDEPYSFGCHYSGPNAAHMPMAQAAQEVVDFIKGIRTISPEVEVGDTEALSVGVTVAELEAWLAAYQTVNGAPFPFFTLDAVFTRPGTFDEAHQLQDWIQAHGTQFAIIYDGDADDTSDVAWLAHAEDAYCRYEQAGGRRPDQVVWQSWHTHPTLLLPETDDTRFMHMINAYYRPITDLKLAVSSGSDESSWKIEGRLSSEHSVPVASVPIVLYRESQQDPGVPGNYEVSGAVPSGAVTARVGLRVNLGMPHGSCDLTVRGFSVGDGTKNLVPDGDFYAPTGWTITGSGTAHWGDATSPSLQVQAAANQTETVESAAFPVHADAAYRFLVLARVAPSAADHGSFHITFLYADGTEAVRQTIPFAPARIELAKTTTLSDGSFAVRCPRPPGVWSILARFAGDEQCRPVSVAQVIPAAQLVTR